MHLPQILLAHITQIDDMNALLTQEKYESQAARKNTTRIT